MNEIERAFARKKRAYALIDLTGRASAADILSVTVREIDELVDIGVTAPDRPARAGRDHHLGA